MMILVTVEKRVFRISGGTLKSEEEGGIKGKGKEEEEEEVGGGGGGRGRRRRRRWRGRGRRRRRRRRRRRLLRLSPCHDDVEQVGYGSLRLIFLGRLQSGHLYHEVGGGRKEEGERRREEEGERRREEEGVGGRREERRHIAGREESRVATGKKRGGWVNLPGRQSILFQCSSLRESAQPDKERTSV